MGTYRTFRMLMDDVMKDVVAQAMHEMEETMDLSDGTFDRWTARDYIRAAVSHAVAELVGDMRYVLEENEEDMTDRLTETVVGMGYECVEEE